MPDLVFLKAPDGHIESLDPAQYDIGKMVSSGWERNPQVMVAAHARKYPNRASDATISKPAPKEPFVVSQIPNAMGLAGNVAGRVTGGAVGALTGGVATPEFLFGGAIPGAVVGQQVGGTLGAGAAGAGGEAMRQMIDAALGIQTPDGGKKLLGAAGEQAAYSLGGELLGQGVKAVGKPLMGAALRMTPEVAQTAIAEGITATKAGLQKTLAKLGEYGARTTHFITTMQRNGVKFDPTELLDRAGQTLGPMVNENVTGEAPEIMGKFQDFATKFMRQFGALPAKEVRPGAGTSGLRPLGSMTPMMLQRFKQQAQEIASPIFEAMNNKETAHLVTAQDKTKAHWFKAMADAAQQMLEEKAPEMVNPATGLPMTLAESNAQTGRLIELKNALAPKKSVGLAARVAGRSVGPAAGAAIGATRPGNRYQNALEGAAIGGAFTSPEVLSWLALRSQSPLLNLGVRSLPYAGSAIMTEPR